MIDVQWKREGLSLTLVILATCTSTQSRESDLDVVTDTDLEDTARDDPSWDPDLPLEPIRDSTEFDPPVGEPPPDPGVDESPVEGGVVGDECSTTMDCTGVPGAGRLCLVDIPDLMCFPAGYCSAICTSWYDCGEGAECLELYGTGPYCYEKCSDDLDCRTYNGYTCTSLPGESGTYCIPPSCY